jgi:uncharacterized protein YndB with AHSA1/START domain
MNTYAIRHEIGIKASPETVYQALTDAKRLAGWWMSDTRGKGSQVGDVLEFWAEDFCQKFEVVELQPGKLVRWKNKEGPEEWVETEVTFSLSADEKRCGVNFSLSG